MPYLHAIDMTGCPDNYCESHRQPRWVCRKEPVQGPCIIGLWPRTFVDIGGGPELRARVEEASVPYPCSFCGHALYRHRQDKKSCAECESCTGYGEPL